MEPNYDSDSSSSNTSSSSSSQEEDNVTPELMTRILDREITGSTISTHEFSKKQLMEIIYHGSFGDIWSDFVEQDSFMELDCDDLKNIVLEHCPDNDDFWENDCVINEFSNEPEVFIDFLEYYPELLSRFEESDFYGTKSILESEPRFLEVVERARAEN